MKTTENFKRSILDKPLPKTKTTTNINFYCQMFCEIVIYYQKKSSSINELQKCLHLLGCDVGSRLVDFLNYKDKGLKQDGKLLNYLLYIKNNVWKFLFGEEADFLEKETEKNNTYYFIEKDSVFNRFLSSKSEGGSNLAFFSAGILQSILSDNGYTCKVTAHFHKGTTFMIVFDDTVIDRDCADEKK